MGFLFYQLGCLSGTDGWWLVVTLLEVSEKEQGVMAIQLPIGSLKTRSGFGAGTEMRTQYLPVH